MSYFLVKVRGKQICGHTHKPKQLVVKEKRKKKPLSMTKKKPFYTCSYVSVLIIFF